ncbi:unnamed protein product [Jaminaea pallidilutea]
MTMTDGAKEQQGGMAHVPAPGPPEGQGKLRIGAYHVPLESEAKMTWHQACQTIATGNLGDLNRNKTCEMKYRAWREPIKAHYGSLEEYIRQVRLNWSDEEVLQSSSQEPPPGLEYFLEHWGEDRVKCIPNDWPYGIPPRCGHYVVWSKSPMLHPLLFQTPDTPFNAEEREAIYEAVVEDGVRGLTGVDDDPENDYTVVGLHTMQLLKEKDGVTVAPAAGENGSARAKTREGAASMAERAHQWAGRHVRAYVQKKWPEDQWQTAWFCNPPHLRTVPGLSHFHVIVRKKESKAAQREI